MLAQSLVKVLGDRQRLPKCPRKRDLITIRGMQQKMAASRFSARVDNHRLLSPQETCVQNNAGDSTTGAACGDGQDPFVFKDPKRENCCLTGFKDLYESGQMFDVTLSIDGKNFGAHRAMLAASSNYFRAMFTNDLAEKGQERININGIDAQAMEAVLKYLYSGEVSLTTDTVQNILSASNLFQLDSLKEGCADFMGRNIDVDNCIGVHFFAQAHECETLEYKAWDVITENFDSVASSQEFLELSADNLIEIIKYDDIHATEEEVFEAAISWLTQKLETHRPQILDVFTHVRFSLIDEHYFYDRVKNNAVFQGEAQMQAIFDTVIQYKLLKGRWMETDLRLEPRHGADFCRVIAYTSYTDDEKKQVVQVYGQRSEDATSRPGEIYCDLPTDIENPALLVTGENDLYVAGGEGCGTSFYKWSVEDQAFEEMMAMSASRKQFCLVQLDKTILALGGCNHDGNMNLVSAYSEENDEWEAVEPMPKALRCFCAVPFCGKLYVFGGESEKVQKKMIRGKKELSKQTLCYDPRKDQWTVMADMALPRALAGCAVFRNKIYLIGGFGAITESWMKDKSPENCLKSVEIYDPETNSWEHGPDLPIPLCAMGVVKYYGTIYVIGGENEDDVSSRVFQLNPEELVWESKDEMVTGVTEITIHSCYAMINIEID